MIDPNLRMKLVMHMAEIQKLGVKRLSLPGVWDDAAGNETLEVLVELDGTIPDGGEERLRRFLQSLFDNREVRVSTPVSLDEETRERVLARAVRVI